MAFLLQHEGIIRIGVFLFVFTVMAFLELLRPRKKTKTSKSHRWFTNLSLVIIDSVALKLFMPVLAVGAANYAAEQGWGLFSVTGFPLWLEIILAILLLDMLIYIQHVASHKIPLLWRLHKVHHVDRDLDVTSGLRFHPIEIILSMCFKLLCVIGLGAPVIAVLLFEILLNASAMFNHSNVRLSRKLDNILRNVIITPDSHRVHHSVIQQETDSNYGFFLSFWDRLFKTYRAQPHGGHDNMKLGLLEFQDQRPNSLIWSLKLPFLRK